MPDHYDKSMQLATLDEDTFDAPDERLEDPRKAWEIFDEMAQREDPRAQDRATIQSVRDGAPPFDPSELRAKGMSAKVNVNFLEMDGAISQALAPYHDLVHSVDLLAWVEPDVADPQSRREWAEIISEEFTRTIRDWSDFKYNFQKLADAFVTNGVGLTHFESDDDWTWTADKLGRFLFPKRTRPSARRVEICCVEEDMTPTELHRKITRDGAEEAGWNAGFGKKMIVEATKTKLSEKEAQTWNWERFQEEVKNNDLRFGAEVAISGSIPVVHYMVTEFDGKVSHYIGIRDEAYADTWLYRNRSKFDDMTQVLSIFTMGIGNGYIHSIRGLGYKLYGLNQLQNRLRSAAGEGAINSSQILLQPPDTGAAQAAQQTRLTPGTGLQILPPGFTVVERAFPNLSTNTFPMTREIQQIVQNNTGQYRSSAQVLDSREKTKAEVEMDAEKETVLESSALNNFYDPWGELLKEKHRRMAEGHGTGSVFIERCVARGVPEDVVRGPAQVFVVRAIGDGSPQLRITVQQRILDISHKFDETGQRNAVQDYLFAQRGVNRFHVRRYIDPAGPRETPAHHFARIENRDFEAMGRTGGAFVSAVTVLSTDEHLTHGSIHIGEYVQPTLQGIGTGAIPGTAIAGVAAALDHVEIHAEALAQDPDRADAAKELFEAVQQLRAMANKVEQQVAEEQAAEEERRKELAAVEIPPEREQELNFIRAKNDEELAALTARNKLEFDHETRMKSLEADRKSLEVA